MCIKINSMYIEQFKGFRNFEITFERDINLIVGENGTGKTTIFEIIFNGLSGNKKYFSNLNLTKIEIKLFENNIEKSLIIKNNSNNIEFLIDGNVIEKEDNFFDIQKVIYFPAEVDFPDTQIFGPTKMNENYKDTKLNSNQMSKDLKQFLVNENYKDLNDIAKGNQNSANRINRMKELFNNFFEDKKFIEIDINDFEPIFELTENKEKMTISELSSGEKQIFYKGGTLLQYTYNKSNIVLIDEPEISMHPEWQQKILQFYKNVNPDNQYIFATHSAYIVNCCDKQNIRKIEKGENNTLILNEDFGETYGATSGEVLFNVFDVETDRNSEIQKDIDEYKDLYYRKDFLQDEELKRLEELKEKLKNNKSLSNDFIRLLELDINTEKTEQYLRGLRGINA